MEFGEWPYLDSYLGGACSVLITLETIVLDPQQTILFLSYEASRTQRPCLTYEQYGLAQYPWLGANNSE